MRYIFIKQQTTFFCRHNFFTLYVGVGHKFDPKPYVTWFSNLYTPALYNVYYFCVYT